MIIITDLDDTLIGSTLLNNDAYNYALERYGYKRIECNGRLTRKNIIKNKDFDKIIKLKQKYFNSLWLPYRVTINKTLLKIIKSNGPEKCFLWTKANAERAESIVNQCNLRSYFKKIIYDKKDNFYNSMLLIKKEVQSNVFTIYEDNLQFFDKCLILNSIKNRHFNIKGFLINCEKLNIEFND